MSSRAWARTPASSALGWVRKLGGLAVGVMLVSFAAGAQAQRHHTIDRGETISALARKYHVSVDTILAANGLDRNDMLRPGDRLRIPPRGVVYVQRGQSLTEIAKKHGVTVDRLVRLNSLQNADTLRAGQRLILPGYEAANAASRAAKRWGRPDHPGVATLVTWNPDRKVTVRLVNRLGRARAAARRQLARLMREPETGKTALPPRRLVQTLARISDHFGGRPITLVSGFRTPGGYTQPTSRHTEGHALDIRIRGVPNKILKRYCRKTFDDVGVGYYPRSTFVHVDVRRDDGYWVDWSRPGEAPKYRAPGAGPPSQDTEQGEAGAVAAKERKDKAQRASASGSGPGSGSPAGTGAEGSSGQESATSSGSSAEPASDDGSKTLVIGSQAQSADG